MLTREQVEKALHSSETNQEAADKCGVSLSTFVKAKSKLGLTNGGKILDNRGLILDRLKSNILNVPSFIRETKIAPAEIYKILHELEEEEYSIEKSLSGYYINNSPKPQDLIHQYYAKKIKFGVIGDTHLCSTEQQLTLLNTFYDICEREKCKIVFHAGDLVDGESVFRGQKYEVFIVGADNQKQYAIEKYPCRKNIETFIISGNHDLNYQKSTGMDIVKAVADKRKDIKYCGQLGAYVELGKNCRAYLYHPDGGGGYAISYKPQRFIAGLAPEKKPNIIFMGHYHRAEYIIDRNVHCIQTGCFQGQTSYLKRKGLDPQIGGWIVELNIDEKGSINRITKERIQFFNPVYRDY